MGAKVVAIAGSTEKCDWLVNELGADAAYNYKDKEWQSKFEAEIGRLYVSLCRKIFLSLESAF